MDSSADEKGGTARLMSKNRPEIDEGAKEKEVLSLEEKT